MTNPSTNIIKRETYHQVEGFLSGFQWDKNGTSRKSGLLFISKATTGANGEREYHDTACRVYNTEAEHMEFINNLRTQSIAANKKDSNQPIMNFFITGNGDWLSYKAETGESVVGSDGKSYPKTRSVTYFSLRDIFVINPSTREILGCAKNHEAIVAAMNPQQAQG